MTPQEPSLATNQVRDPSTFPLFKAFPGVQPAQLDKWLLAVKIQAISAMEWRWPKHWTIAPRTINDSMFFWFQSGSGKAWFRRPNEVVHFNAGDMLLIPHGVEHAIEGSAHEEAHVYAVHFYASLFGGIDLLSMLGFPIYIASQPDSPYLALAERLALNAATRAPGWERQMEDDIFAGLLNIVRTQPEHFTPLRSMESQADLPRLVPVLNWIDKNIAKHDFTVADLAGLIYLSETHFRRLFHQVFGISPIQFVRQRRIERACGLLRRTNLPIKQISSACGFAEEAFFSRVFRKVTGKSPAVYRKSEVI